MHFYDEQRLLLGKTYQAGDKVRLTAPAGSNAAWTVIDLLDSELVGPPHVELVAANVLLFGADPTGRRDSADAFDKAIAFAKRTDLKVYIPPGTYQVNRHIIVDDVTIEGAGNWYTIIKGQRGRARARPAPDGSVHTGVGFYGKDAADGGSSNVHLSGFAIEGDVRERIDTDQVNGDRRRDERLDDRRPLHPPHQGGPVVRRPDDERDGHQQRHRRPDRRRAQLPHRRHQLGGARTTSSATPATTAWRCGRRRPPTRTTRSTTTPCRRRRWPTASRSTAAPTTRSRTTWSPTRSARAAACTPAPGSARRAFAGHLWFTDNTTVRAGTYELNWNIGLGAIWIYALDKSIDADIQVTGDHFLDNTYNAIMLVSDWPVKDLYSITQRPLQGHPGRRHRHLGGQRPGRRVGARSRTWTPATSARSASTTAGRSTSPPAGSEFSLTDLGGNDGGGTTGPWLAPWELPNTITCDDRPPVVVPPAPSRLVSSTRRALPDRVTRKAMSVAPEFRRN